MTPSTGRLGWRIWQRGRYYAEAGMHIPDADYFVDGLLVPCAVEDCSGSPPSAVRADSWGRIKAGFAP